jgi:Uma2 family endonuclease
VKFAGFDLVRPFSVVRRCCAGRRQERRAPLLAVEVLSPSSVLKDLNLKKAAYQRMGVPSYWVIDPVKASLIVFELDSKGFTYQLIAEVVGDKAFEATQPFAVRIVPAELLGRFRQN